MNRREVLLGLGATGVTSSSLANPTDGAMTAADVHVVNYPTVAAMRWISDTLEERTQGRLRIRVYHSGQLGRESDTVALTRFGALDFTRVNFGALTNPFPLTEAFVLPYVFQSVAHMRRAADSAVGKSVLRSFERRGLIGLAIYDAGSRNFYNVRRPVVEPRDLHGLKIRVQSSDIFIALGRALGANPTPLPTAEVYSAMQTHLIDGAENNWSTFYTSRQFEVARYWSQSEHSYSPEALLLSKRSFDALEARDREVVIETARESVAHMRLLWDRMEAESRAHVLESGVKINDVDRETFHRAALPVVERYVKKSGLETLYEGIRALA